MKTPLPASPLSFPLPLSLSSPSHLFSPVLSSDGFFSQSCGTGAAAGETDIEAERLLWTDAGSERSVASDNHRGARERPRKRERALYRKIGWKGKERQEREVNMWQDVVSLCLQNIGIQQSYFEHDLSTVSVQVCLSSNRWWRGRRSKPLELLLLSPQNQRSCFSAACLPACPEDCGSFKPTSSAAAFDSLSDRTWTHPAFELFSPPRSRMRFSAGSTGPVAAFVSKQWTFQANCERGKFVLCFHAPEHVNEFELSSRCVTVRTPVSLDSSHCKLGLHGSSYLLLRFHSLDIAARHKSDFWAVY